MAVLLGRLWGTIVEVFSNFSWFSSFKLGPPVVPFTLFLGRVPLLK